MQSQGCFFFGDQHHETLEKSVDKSNFLYQINKLTKKSNGQKGQSCGQKCQSCGQKCQSCGQNPKSNGQNQKPVDKSNFLNQINKLAYTKTLDKPVDKSNFLNQINKLACG